MALWTMKYWEENGNVCIDELQKDETWNKVGLYSVFYLLHSLTNKFSRNVNLITRAASITSSLIRLRNNFTTCTT